MSSNFHIKGRQFPFEDEVIDIWVKNGHITYSEPKEYEKFNQDPVFILPGLVDSHVHLSFDFSKYDTPEFLKTAGDPINVQNNLEGNLHSGVLLLRDIGSVGPATLQLTRNSDLPNVIRAGNFLAPPNGFMDVVQYVTAADLPQVAVEQIKQGYEWVKIIGDWWEFNPTSGKPETKENYPQETIFETVKEVHKIGGKIAMHTEIEASVATAVEAGIDSLEHGFPITRTQLEVMGQKNMIWVPTLTLLVSDMQHTNDAGAKERIKSRLENMKDKIAFAHELGIPILAGTDVLPPGQVHVEVNALATYGLSPVEALKSATITPRKSFNEGIFEEGDPADILLFNNNPIDDLNRIENPMKVIFNGKTISH